MCHMPNRELTIAGQTSNDDIAVVPLAPLLPAPHRASAKPHLRASLDSVFQGSQQAPESIRVSMATGGLASKGGSSPCPPVTRRSPRGADRMSIHQAQRLAPKKQVQRQPSVCRKQPDVEENLAMEKSGSAQVKHVMHLSRSKRQRAVGFLGSSVKNCPRCHGPGSLAQHPSQLGLEHELLAASEPRKA